MSSYLTDSWTLQPSSKYLFFSFLETFPFYLKYCKITDKKSNAIVSPALLFFFYFIDILESLFLCDELPWVNYRSFIVWRTWLEFLIQKILSVGRNCLCVYVCNKYILPLEKGP